MSNHLRFDLVNEVVGNTGHDEHGCTCEPYAFHSGQLTEQCRYEYHDAQEACVTPVEAVSHLGDELGCRTTRTNTRDKSAVLLKVLRDLDRIELDHRVEEHECENADKVSYIVERASAKVTEPVYDDVVAVREEESNDRGRQSQERHGKDYRHNAGSIYLERNVCVLSAIDFTADDLLTVLNRDSSFCVLNVYAEDDGCDRDQGNDHESGNTQCITYRLVSELTGDVESIVVERSDHIRDSCYDTREDDKGYTVTDTLFVDSFTEEYNKRRTSGKCQDNECCSEPLRKVIRHGRACSVGEEGSLHYSKTYCKITGDLLKLLLSLFSLFGKILQSRDSNRKELDDDGRVDVRCNTHREDGCRIKTTTCDDIHQATDLTPILDDR